MMGILRCILGRHTWWPRTLLHLAREDQCRFCGATRATNTYGQAERRAGAMEALVLAAQLLRDQAGLRYDTHGGKDPRGAALWDAGCHIDPWDHDALGVHSGAPAPHQRPRDAGAGAGGSGDVGGAVGAATGEGTS